MAEGQKKPSVYMVTNQKQFTVNLTSDQKPPSANMTTNQTQPSEMRANQKHPSVNMTEEQKQSFFHMNAIQNRPSNTKDKKQQQPFVFYTREKKQPLPIVVRELKQPPINEIKERKKSPLAEIEQQKQPIIPKNMEKEQFSFFYIWAQKEILPQQIQGETQPLAIEANQYKQTHFIKAMGYKQRPVIDIEVQSQKQAHVTEVQGQKQLPVIECEGHYEPPVIEIREQKRPHVDEAREQEHPSAVVSNADLPEVLRNDPWCMWVWSPCFEESLSNKTTTPEGATARFEHQSLQDGSHKIKTVMVAEPEESGSDVLAIESKGQIPVIKDEGQKQQLLIETRVHLQSPVSQCDGEKQPPVIDVQSQKQLPVTAESKGLKQPNVDEARSQKLCFDIDSKKHNELSVNEVRRQGHSSVSEPKVDLPEVLRKEPCSLWVWSPFFEESLSNKAITPEGASAQCEHQSLQGGSHKIKTFMLTEPGESENDILAIDYAGGGNSWKSLRENVRIFDDVQYELLVMMSRCVHLDEALPALWNPILIPKDILRIKTINNPELMSTTVLWFGVSQSPELHNIFGNVTFTISWNQLFLNFGPNMYVIGQRFSKTTCFTQILLTRRTYHTLTTLDHDSIGSPLIRTCNGFFYAGQIKSPINGKRIRHHINVAVEAGMLDGAWIYRESIQEANAHDGYVCYRSNKKCALKFSREKTGIMMLDAINKLKQLKMGSS